MACYLKCEVSFGPISFEQGKADWHLNWPHSIIWTAILVQQNWKLELQLILLDWNVNEREIKRVKVQIKPPYMRKYSVYSRVHNSLPFCLCFRGQEWGRKGCHSHQWKWRGLLGHEFRELRFSEVKGRTFDVLVRHFQLGCSTSLLVFCSWLINQVTYLKLRQK